MLSKLCGADAHAFDQEAGEEDDKQDKQRQAVIWRVGEALHLA
jgi:hypothetical protein